MGDVQERRCISNSLTKRNISVLTEGCAASIIDQKTNQSAHFWIACARPTEKVVEMLWKSRYTCHPFTAHCISEQKISKFKREEKKRKQILKTHLKRKKKSITDQEDGTSFPPHKILKHLKDLKI